MKQLVTRMCRANQHMNTNILPGLGGNTFEPPWGNL